MLPGAPFGIKSSASPVLTVVGRNTGTGNVVSASRTDNVNPETLPPEAARRAILKVEHMSTCFQAGLLPIVTTE